MGEIHIDVNFEDASFIMREFILNRSYFKESAVKFHFFLTLGFPEVEDSDDPNSELFLFVKYVGPNGMIPSSFISIMHDSHFSRYYSFSVYLRGIGRSPKGYSNLVVGMIRFHPWTFSTL